MSESSDEEFDGFSQNEVDAAAQRYNDRLAQIGIGEFDVVDSENEIENEFSDENEPLVDETGDRPAEADGEQAPQPGDPNYSKLYKIESLNEYVHRFYGKPVYPKRQLSVDEVMVPWKGQLSFKQYMPAKPTKWGIKMWR
ncbi:Hypothetical predicted protein [Mytilus galloprovincialis]|uniref:PiggyBac transposable element-derived protein domain-containing protein n=1 Tax=Mytilus galloprovincialis TaxID=29158 RepID=A0A8B6CCU2_MYTGA|nr:Hypothetical predicted protein [Mytilus galloprovincialis]